ncbi:hypothetical protein BC628DRAFT_1399244 [Trametes gibbosa]|nr:hypothetical protein BC628DRAFT_1399244 [Trametes gibbosa]
MGVKATVHRTSVYGRRTFPSRVAVDNSNTSFSRTMPKRCEERHGAAHVLSEYGWTRVPDFELRTNHGSCASQVGRPRFKACGHPGHTSCPPLELFRGSSGHHDDPEKWTEWSATCASNKTTTIRTLGRARAGNTGNTAETDHACTYTHAVDSRT